MEWKTIRFTRIVDDEFNAGTWLKEIIKKIRFSDMVMINVGFSFIAQKNDSKIYLYCPKLLAPYKIKCTTVKEAMDFAEEIENKTQAYHLENTFVTTTDTGNPFKESGYIPINLVCNYIWITK